MRLFCPMQYIYIIYMIYIICVETSQQLIYNIQYEAILALKRDLQ